MLDEYDAIRLWRQLFQDAPITSLTLVQASSLIEAMSPESPVRTRLAAELEDIRSLHQGQQPKRVR